MMKEDESPKPEAAAETEVPEASPEENTAAATDAEKAAPKTQRRTLYLIGGIALVVAVVLCIVLPLTLIDNDDDDNSNASRNRSDMIFVGADQERQEAFQAKLPLFGQSITEGYQDPTEMQDALAVAFEREASAYVAQSVQQFNNNNQYQNMRPSREEDMAMMDGDAMAMPEMAESNAMMAGDSAGGATDSVTDFETNNQEENVDEADM